jgi:hypothetical protein
MYSLIFFPPKDWKKRKKQGRILPSAGILVPIARTIVLFTSSSYLPSKVSGAPVEDISTPLHLLCCNNLLK